MATAYDSWKEGNCGVDAREAARDEFITERTEELTQQRLTSTVSVAESAAQFTTEELSTFAEASIAKFFVAAHAAKGVERPLANAAYELLRDIGPTIEAHIRRDAESDAASEADKHFPEHDDRDPEGLQAVAA